MTAGSDAARLIRLVRAQHVGSETCVECDMPMPCDAIRLADALEDALAVVERVTIWRGGVMEGEIADPDGEMRATLDYLLHGVTQEDRP